MPHQLSRLLRRLMRSLIFGLCATLMMIAPLASQDAPDAINAPLSSAFTYQGRLENGGTLVNADCAMTFSLFDASTAGTQVGSNQAINPVTVSDGLFVVSLNGAVEFGATAFDGSARFLEIAVQCPGDPSPVVLPRQQLTAAPYAITSLSTEGLQGRPVAATAPTTGQALAWNGTQWTPQTIGTGGPADWSSLSGIPAGFLDNLDNDSGGDITAVNAGSGLTGGGGAGDVALALDTSVTDSLYWQLDGNAGVPSSGFLGTTDKVTLTLGVSNTTALRILPNVDPSMKVVPTIIGGISANSVASGVLGAVIAGGGSAPSDQNRVFDNFGVIAGGLDNIVGVDDASLNAQGSAVIGGGQGNQALAPLSTIAGGRANFARGDFSSVGGGRINQANGDHATVPGGEGAIATLRGQLAYASGGFETGPGIQDVGSAQMSIYVLRNAGTGNLSLILDGNPSGSDDDLAVRAGASMAFMILVVGRSNTGVAAEAAYRIEGLIVGNDTAGTATILGTPVVTTLGETGFPNANLLAGVTTSSGNLVVSVTNGTGQDMRWVATVYTSEVVED